MNTTVPKEYDALLALYQAQSEELRALKDELEQLKRMLFGMRKESFRPAQEEAVAEGPPQGGGSGEEGAPQEGQERVQVTYTRKKNANHKGRQPLPDHLPVEEVTIDPDFDTTGMKYIGDEITETVDYRPATLVKRRYIRRKYVRAEAAEGQPEVVIGELPYRPIRKGIAEAGLLAHLMVSKYVDHLPFYRQIERFKREYDWNIQKSTVNDWFTAGCTLLEPLYKALKGQVLQTGYLQADESPIRVLDNTKAKKTHKGFMWVYRNPGNKLVWFDYRQGRSSEDADGVLGGFSGLLQCDGYPVYASLAARRGDIRLVSCLAHIRRKFFEAQSNHPEPAAYALGLIQQLYAFERGYREGQLTPEETAGRRRQEARPVFETLKAWVLEQHGKYLGKEAIGKALLYAGKELPQLEVYLDDGRIEIDNNLIENAIRPMAIGRKNYLFCGSHDAAERTAMMYSFFATCKTTGVNPWEWMQDVLQRLENYPQKSISELLPGNWRPPPPQVVQTKSVGK